MSRDRVDTYKLIQSSCALVGNWGTTDHRVTIIICFLCPYSHVLRCFLFILLHRTSFTYALVCFRERRVIAVDGDSANSQENRPNRVDVFGATASQGVEELLQQRNFWWMRQSETPLVDDEG